MGILTGGIGGDGDKVERAEANDRGHADAVQKGSAAELASGTLVRG